MAGWWTLDTGFRAGRKPLDHSRCIVLGNTLDIESERAEPTGSVRSDPSSSGGEPGLFRDYWRTVRLERWAHFDEIAKVQAPARPNIDLPRENTPSRVVEDPNFFIHYQILRRMEQFQHFESVQNVHNINEEQI